MLYFIKYKKDCTGCAACLNVCPTNCITMIQDDEGFNYPVADDRCIHCKKCEKVCPIASGETQSTPEIKQYAAAAVANDIDVWKASTSGGAFTEICNAYGDQSTIIFGAAFNGLKVVHIYAVGIENIGILRKSKYVQSDIKNSFNKVRKFLEQGKKVVFSGTPCQVAGLRSYLNNEYENLFCIDLICHGVGSPKVFNEVMQYLSEKYGLEIKSYSFRNKKIIMGNLKEYISSYIFENNKGYSVERDEYNRLFFSQLCLRKSCGSNCRFRSSNRLGDITIADFKNKNKVFPELRDCKNYSTIIVNSYKGDFVYKKLGNRMTILPCDLQAIKTHNPLFYRHTEDNPLRNQFFEDFTKGVKIEELINKYIPNKGIWEAVKDFIPYNFGLWYSKIVKTFPVKFESK